jgi:hypothetical protein
MIKRGKGKYEIQNKIQTANSNLQTNLPTLRFFATLQNDNGRKEKSDSKAGTPVSPSKCLQVWGRKNDVLRTDCFRYEGIRNDGTGFGRSLPGSFGG